MVERKSHGDQSDGHRVDAHINPSGMKDAEIEVEGKADEQAPGGRGSLTSTNRDVVESRPRVVDEQSFEPRWDITVLVDGLQAESNESKTGDQEHGVAHDFVVEPVNGFTEGSVRRFKGQQSAPRNMLRWMGHAKHVEGCKKHAPCAEENHGWSVHGNGSR